MQTTELDHQAKRVLDVLYSNAYGRSNGLRIGELTELVTEKRTTAANERRIRQIILSLRERGWPICAHPVTGYFWATNSSDLESTIGFLRGRAMASLRQISRLKKHSLPVLAGQLALPVAPPSPYVEPSPELEEDRGRVSLEVEIPERLANAVGQWVLRNPDWDQQRVLAEALRLFLVLSPEVNGDE